MSVIRSTQYPGRWNVPDSNSPQGSGKNRTAVGSNDGSYFDKVWFDDMDSLHQALFIASGITPNGVQDVGTASQIFDALLNNRWSAIGNYSVGTIVTASNGKQYYCNQDSGRDSNAVDPVTDALDRWREYPYEEIITATATAKKYFNGDLDMFGKGFAYSSSQQPASIQLPVNLASGFDKNRDDIQATHIGTSENVNMIVDTDNTTGKINEIFIKTSFSGSAEVLWSMKSKWSN